jgi:C-terminal processing protease CtpA/Prc
MAMKWLIALVSACILSGAALAETPAERFDQQTAQAKSLAEKHAFGAAAALLEKMAGDVAMTTQPGWADTIYQRARYEAAAGQTDKAIASLTSAVDAGAVPRSNEVAKEAEFAALAELPAFKVQVARIEKGEALWKDDPALATPYKPVLSDEEKAAGLSKLWAEARFNFPFFSRIPEVDWDAQYMAYLQQVRAAKTTEEYYRVLTRFMATLKDGHTRVLPPAELMDQFNGVTAVETKLVQGKIIVTGIDDPALSGIHVGDEIVSIDGKPALEYAKTDVDPYVFGFTPQDRAMWLYGYQLLRGPLSKPVNLTVKSANGKITSVAVPRHHNNGAFGILPEMGAPASFKMLPGNIAYLKIDWFVDDAGLKTLKANFAAASAANGLIIDIRDNGGGNDDNSHDLVKVLANKPFQGSNWRTIDYKAAYRSWNRPLGWQRSGAPTFQPDAALHYGKPVVVLVGPRTYSAAEDFLVSFLSADRGKLIGETTGGSTGNPMLIKLPGGGMAFICTKDDSFASGRVFEGVGIAPDIAVRPTIADIRAGRDPVVEKAVELVKMGR